MKLYYMPGACSLAPHIALRESDLSFSLVEVDYRTRKTACGKDFRKINPKGYVPALILEMDWLLTEVPVILQYINSLAPAAALLPLPGSPEHLRALEWLSYLATEIHKSFSPLFRSSTPHSFLRPGRDHLWRRLDFIEEHLAQNRFLLGSSYCIADSYLFTLSRWLGDQDLALSTWPALSRHHQDIAGRPAVKAALAVERATVSKSA